MALLFFIGTFILQIKGTPKAAEILAQSGDLSFYIYALKQSLMFTGGIAVVLLGVRMFIGEMVPAFNGIGSRLVPGPNLRWTARFCSTLRQMRWCWGSSVPLWDRCCG